MSAHHGIIPELEHLAVPVRELVPHGDNPNEGDVGAIAHQFEVHGQHTPILVQASTGTIIAGEHRWRAANLLGWTHIAAVVVPYSNIESTAVMVGDNLPARRSRDDDERLEALLVGLHQAGRLERTGYSAEDLEELVQRRLLATNPPELEPRQTGPSLPVVEVRLAPSTYEAWCSLVAKAGTTEARVFEDLVRRAREGKS